MLVVRVEVRVAVLSCDPSRRKTGGALLGDRIRMNAIGPWSRGPRVYFRSLATRDAGHEVSRALPDVVAAAKVAGFDLVVVETPGIGQGDAAIVPIVDVPLYVMTPEYGAPSQLEKIDMLDFAAFVAINKFDRRGAADALRDVSKQVQRNRGAFGERPESMPVFGTTASRFNDDGVTALYQALKPRLKELGLHLEGGRLPEVKTRHSTSQAAVVPGSRTRYLAEIADTVRGYKKRAAQQAALAREVQQLRAARQELQPFLDLPASSLTAVLQPTLESFDKMVAQLKEQGKDTSEIEARGPANVVRVMMALVAHESGHRASLQTLLRLQGVNAPQE